MNFSLENSHPENFHLEYTLFYKQYFFQLSFSVTLLFHELNFKCFLGVI